MNLSYQEKRIWINLSTQGLVYGVYFFELWRGRVTVGALVNVIVAITVLQIALQSVLAMTARRERKDERDLAIERRAYRNGYNILVGALLACLALLALPAFDPTLRQEFQPSPFHVINVLLLALLVAEAGKLLSQLVLYRKAA